MLCELEKTMDRGGLGEPSPELRTGLHWGKGPMKLEKEFNQQAWLK